MSENGTKTPKPDYSQPDAVILRHPEAGVMRLDPTKFGPDAQKAAKKEGWTVYEPPKDGFRKPKRRPKGWLAKAIKEGWVADPNVGPQPHQEYPPETFVVEVPILTVSGEAPPAGG